MDQIIVKKIDSAEAVLLQKIAIQTFSETFASSNTPENLENYIVDKLSIESLTEELQNTDSQFYFALYRDVVVGYLKINLNNAQTEPQPEEALEIERIYVLQDYQGKKIGQILYSKALEVARENNLKYVWLGVWEENHQALQFYRKNGFIEFGQHVFQFGDEAQTDLMMKKIL